MIVDASVIVKWINTDEPDADKALALYKNHVEKKKKIIVPNLLFIEVANFLATKSTTSGIQIKESLSFIYSSHLIISDITQAMLVESAVLAKQYKTSVYDMLYAVIAKRRKTTLITADAKFVIKTKFPFVKVLSDLV